MSARIINIPNSLSMARLALVPVLLYCADKGLQTLFLYVLAASLSTDYFDGYLARKLTQTTPWGAILDSWGDFFTSGAMLFGLMWLWPEIYQ
ncbi:MAG: CDP-alcohol phosphatidyltransferase family protein, partial [Porticoccaceae bacterium]|nr:CDP-alcohol phosphatidyltransferase family protein [Porticoccaceae bacterium]